MKTYNRICIRDYTVIGEDGEIFTIERGKEYLTSEIAHSPAFMVKELPPEDGYVTVFTKYWIKAPVNIFAGEIIFTDV